LKNLAGITQAKNKTQYMFLPFPSTFKEEEEEEPKQNKPKTKQHTSKTSSDCKQP